MVSTRSLYLPFLLALGLVLHSGASTAAPSLAEAIKQADAKYLDVPDVTPADTAPKIEAGGGEEAATPGAQEISEGTLKATLSYIEDKSTEGDVTRAPVVTVFADGKEVAKLEGDSGGSADPPVSVQIAELDPGNSNPEVVVSFYTGGAHCCSDTSVVTSSPDGSTWTTIDVGEFDGGPMLATDLDGDGRYEFETRDNAFLYTFGCYACSEAPLEAIAIENGAVKNVTSEGRFKPAHQAWLKSMIENVPDEDVNGFLAGYVGEKILLGEGKQAWDLMLAYYDKASDWGLEVCDQPLNQEGDCPGQEVKLTFPDALQRMLKENGYKIEN
ncbi:MAG: hypothetical protein JJE37_14205 [Methyloceanibacter sp.]|jgi:hypothetical protein|nr:hypothetical protein [Methyloceanibacter sp.]